MPHLPLLSLLLFFFVASCRSAAETQPDSPLDLTDEAAVTARAADLAHRYIIVDGHIDVPYRMTELSEDVSVRTAAGDFDYVRAKEGGLNAPFMSIYIPSARQATPGSAKALADSLIDLVEGFVERAPDKYAIAVSPADVRRHFREDKVSLPMGMENGAPVEDDLANLQHFYERGIRYITLAHARDNQLSDSSYDTTRTWNGLSDFGEEVVREMNRLGIMVDVSHISDSAFYDVMRVTRAPVIASHSSVRDYTPGWERNMSDDLIRRLAENDGVIMINFGSSFLKTEYQASGTQIQQQLFAQLRAEGLEPDAPEGIRMLAGLRRAHPVGTVRDVADHIDHVANLVGVRHVGLGSDFDGVFALPEGLQDVSEYPNLVAELLRRGYSNDDIEGILGGNVLRVWEDVEQVAGEMQ